MALVGCGGDESDQPTTAVKPPALTEQAKLAEPAPRGASLELKEIYRQFQPPEPDPEVKGSGKAIAQGEKECKGMTPTEVMEAFIAESDLTEDQERALEDLPRYEQDPSPSFPAGQLGALVYQNAQSDEKLAAYGFQGCVYALSLELKKELAPK